MGVCRAARPPARQAARAPGAGAGARAAAQAIHPQTSALRAPQVQVFVHSQALLPPEHRDAPSEIPAADGDMRRALRCQPLGSRASQGQLEIAGARRWVGGFGPAGADPGVSRSRKHCANVPRFTCRSPF